MSPRELKLLAKMNNMTPEEYVAEAAVSTLELLKGFAELNSQEGFTLIRHEGYTLMVFEDKLKGSLNEVLLGGDDEES